jgi:hypothetical protein
MADTEPTPLLAPSVEIPGVHVDGTLDDDELDSPLDDPELTTRRFRDNIHGYSACPLLLPARACG